MTYGLELYNAAGNLILTSNDTPYVAYQRYFLSVASTSTSTQTWDYQTGGPYGTPGLVTQNASKPIYTYSWPSGLTPNIDHVYGFNVPYGKSVFCSTIYNTTAAYRLIYSDSSTLEMISAGPLLSLDNYPSIWGMIVYDSAGTPVYHSDARIMKIVTRLNSSGAYNADGQSPYMFFTGNWFYYVNTTSNRWLRYCGCRLDSSTAYTRRVISIGSSLPSAVTWEADPLGSAFIGLVDKSLF